MEPPPTRAPEDYIHLITRLLDQGGYRPAYVKVARDAVSVWFWVGETTIQISRGLLSDARALAEEIAFEAQQRGVIATRQP